MSGENGPGDFDLFLAMDLSAENGAGDLDLSGGAGGLFGEGRES